MTADNAAQRSPPAAAAWRDFRAVAAGRNALAHPKALGLPRPGAGGSPRTRPLTSSAVDAPLRAAARPPPVSLSPTARGARWWERSSRTGPRPGEPSELVDKSALFAPPLERASAEAGKAGRDLSAFTSLHAFRHFGPLRRVLRLASFAPLTRYRSKSSHYGLSVWS